MLLEEFETLMETFMAEKVELISKKVFVNFIRWLVANRTKYWRYKREADFGTHYFYYKDLLTLKYNNSRYHFGSPLHVCYPLNLEFGWWQRRRLHKALENLKIGLIVEKFK